jgi:hypothetical protein
MEQSILKSIKKLLGVGDDDTSFDLDIITHINHEFSILNDAGVGPPEGFVIEDETEEWDSYFPDEDDPAKLKVQLSKVKTAVFLRVKLLFDPPTVSYLLDATKAQLQEAEWRLNVNREATEWVDPDPPIIADPELSI